MSELDSEWLVKRIQDIVDSPRNPRSLIASSVDENASREYARQVRDHFAQKAQSSADQGTLRRAAR